MATVIHPTKEQVRAWMKNRVEHPSTPPSTNEIRRQLGWPFLKPFDPQDITR